MKDDGLDPIRERAKTCPFASILLKQIAAGHPERESLIAMFAALSIAAEEQRELLAQAMERDTRRLVVQMPTLAQENRNA